MGRPTNLTLKDALMILTTERLMRCGLSQPASLACASSVADAFSEILSGRKEVVYAFFIKADSGLYHSTTCFNKKEATEVFDAQPGAVILPLHKLAAEFMAEIAAATGGVNAT